MKKHISNLWEILEKNDWLHTGPETKLRVGRDFIWKYCTSVKSVGNFGWALAQNLYSVEEMTERNYNGNGQKSALSPRRRHAIEEAVIENYGEGHMKQVRTAINTGIRGINCKIRNSISNEPSSKRRLLLGGGQLPTLLQATYKVVQSATSAMIAYN